MAVCASAERRVKGSITGADAQALVRDSIPRDFPETPLRLRLALGAEIPGDVELYEFPVIVLDRVPSLRDYRFLVTGEQIGLQVNIDLSGLAITVK